LVELVAVSDVNSQRVAEVSTKERIQGYDDPVRLMEDSGAESILITTPHYFHTPLAIAAFERGLHVLCEKPVGVHVNDVQMMIDAHEAALQDYPGLIFAAMFQRRVLGHWRKIKHLITEGSLGRLVRASWIITTWFRTQSYYNQSDWRATWRGEGGGILLNQCPHNLDIYQWFFGMPERVRGFASMGKYHNIEVEDEVTAIFEHSDGMVGHFITSTIESPGTNRFEIVGELGRVVFEDEKLIIDYNEKSMLTVSETSDEPFIIVPYSSETTAAPVTNSQHLEVIERFAQAVCGDGEPIAYGAEGMGSVMLANAVLASHFAGTPVDLPLDGDAYASLLEDLIANPRS
jgi:predicted dehydrogenase